MLWGSSSPPSGRMCGLSFRCFSVWDVWEPTGLFHTDAPARGNPKIWIDREASVLSTVFRLVGRRIRVQNPPRTSFALAKYGWYGQVRCKQCAWGRLCAVLSECLQGESPIRGLQYRGRAVEEVINASYSPYVYQWPEEDTAACTAHATNLPYILQVRWCAHLYADVCSCRRAGIV